MLYAEKIEFVEGTLFLVEYVKTPYLKRIFCNSTISLDKLAN